MVRLATVTGEVTADPEGIAAVGERLIARLPVPRPKRASDSAFYDQPVTMSRLGDLMTGRANRDDAILRPADAELELRRFAEAGGRLVVDVTAAAEGRDISALRRLSETTGMHIVVAATADDMPSTRTAALGEGGAGLLAITTPEDGALTAAFAAANDAGVPVLMDASADRLSPLLHAAIDAGLTADRVAFRPAEASVADIDALREVTAAGAYLLFDGLGRIPTVHTRVSDHDVAGLIARLVGANGGDRIMIGAGLTRRHAFTAFGGHGLPFLAGQFVPYLQMLGLTAAQAERIGGRNAWEFLDREGAR